jgi:murein L,D-transpeptidase YafK
VTRRRLLLLLILVMAAAIAATRAKPIARYVANAYLTRFAYPMTSLAQRAREHVASHPGETGKRLVFDKSDSRLEVWEGGEMLKSYAALQGHFPERDKRVEGDFATPEGEFYICRKNPQSAFHKFLLISYPNKEDAERGLRDRLISREEYRQIVTAIDHHGAPPQNTRLGGNVGIHGGACLTWGCVSLTDDEIDELYGWTDLGTKLTIRR